MIATTPGHGACLQALGRWNDSTEGTQPSSQLEKKGKFTMISTHTKRNSLSDLTTVLDLQPMHHTCLEDLQVSQSGITMGPAHRAFSQPQSSPHCKIPRQPTLPNGRCSNICPPLQVNKKRQCCSDQKELVTHNLGGHLCR